MLETIDPATGKPLPPDAIQRVLFVSNSVHVYNIPPMPSNRGYVASAWTADPARHIFTARMRLLETSFDTPLPTDTSSSSSSSQQQDLKADVVLEDPSTGNLFAAAPYTSAAVVESVIDSSRFFAITVKDPNGKKAVLGIGFEERSEAFDLGVALQEARRALGWDLQRNQDSEESRRKKKEEEAAKDYSLKEGETITVNLGGTKFGRRRQQKTQEEQEGDLQSFILPPPPPPAGAVGGGDASGGFGFGIKPPPSARDVKEKRKSARDLGFDDGQFGEFA